ncbi:MAG: hypothetical protein MZV49_09415 [Rhodopseudomonas palustris]|nr:hypothetical protein [Rhodopseudomonas palustris]
MPAKVLRDADRRGDRLEGRRHAHLPGTRRAQRWRRMREVAPLAAPEPGPRARIDVAGVAAAGRR